MIGFLKGKIYSSDGSKILIVTNYDVGYEVFYPEILSNGLEVSLYTSQIFKENSVELFGFKTLKDKKIFELLLSVKGVGPKTAFLLINGLKADGILNAIMFEDKKTLQSVPGIGGKTASQILLDLKDKAQKMSMTLSATMSADTVKSSRKINEAVEVESTTGNDQQILVESLMALKSLGFNESEIIPKVKEELRTREFKNTKDLVSVVLKGMMHERE
ncbi:MAG: Holliday junction branch migration protein RuvA [Bacteriovoracaceae bacterium]